MCSRNNYNDDVVLDEIELIEVDGWETGGRGPPKHKVVLKACYLIFLSKLYINRYMLRLETCP